MSASTAIRARSRTSWREFKNELRRNISLTNRLWSPGERKLPDFVILGAQKAGTTSLFRYLLQHPLVQRPLTKEVHFYDLNFHRGISWYRRHFPTVQQRETGRDVWGIPAITGEATPYYLFHPAVPARLADVAPAARLIILLRNPATRAYSHYQHERHKGRETLTFEDAIAAEPQRLAGDHDRLCRDEHYRSFAHRHFSYLARSRYREQLMGWFQHFDRRQILIIQSEELNANPGVVYQRVLDFLSLPSHRLTMFPRANGRAYPPMSPSTHQYLRSLFRDDNEQLLRDFELPFDWNA